MRAVWNPEDLQEAWDSARQESKAAFGNDSMYMEKLIEEPRHIEIQIVGDSKGSGMSSFRKRLFYSKKTSKTYRRNTLSVYD